MDKKKREKMRSNLTSMQEVRYQRDFKLADRAAGFEVHKKRD
ncbi:MAG TPA: YfhE family protein [Bacillus sp. (in: firmicutes)]|nr:MULTISPECIES: YfhE family protein [Bacillus]HWO74666.1 YfhE family protein [Bacillus sp. (in: firmicutes)]